MKKKLLTILLAVMLIAGTIYAAGHSWTRYKHTTVATATGTAVSAAPGYLYKAIVRGDKASTCTMDVYDFGTNDTFSTTTEFELFPTIIVTTAEVAWYHNLDFNPAVKFYAGLYVYLTSTGEVTVYWQSDN